MTVRATSAASTSAAAASDVSRSAFVRLVSVPRVIHVSSLHRVDLGQRRACRVTVVDARAAAGRGPGRGVGEIDRGRRSRGVHTLLGAHTRCAVLLHLHLGLVVLLAVARVQIRPRRVVVVEQDRRRPCGGSSGGGRRRGRTFRRVSGGVSVVLGADGVAPNFAGESEREHAR